MQRVWGERRGAYRVLVGKPEGKNHLEDQGINGRVILRWIFTKLTCGVMDWIELTQNRNGCYAVVFAVMNLRVA